MIDNNILLANGDNFERYHERHFKGMTGFPRYHNTNIDKVCRFLDEWPFQTCLDYEEQDKAQSIDYAHGLELDDNFGDPYGINRNGLDDDQYRFILKCHRMAINCNGTLPELIHYISTVLQCTDNDVTLGMARHYDKTGQLTGEPDTIIIRNINIENIPDDQLIPLLSDELQIALAADKRVDQADFYTIINTPIVTGVGMTVSAQMTVSMPNDINDHLNPNLNENTGVGIAINGKMSI